MQRAFLLIGITVLIIAGIGVAYFQLSPTKKLKNSTLGNFSSIQSDSGDFNEFPDFKVNKASNISGKWNWAAFDKTGDVMLAMGGMDVEESRGEITGRMYAINPLQSSFDSKSYFALINRELVGKRISSERIAFVVNKGKVDETLNKVFIKNNGYTMVGKSKVTKIINKKNIPAYYYWEAFKIN